MKLWRLTNLVFYFHFQAEFLDSKLQCCVVQSSPKMLSPAPVPRSLIESGPAPTVQTIYSSHKPISLADRYCEWSFCRIIIGQVPWTGFASGGTGFWLMEPNADTRWFSKRNALSV